MKATLELIRNNAQILALINGANRCLEVIGYTEHGPRHVSYVSHTAASILRQLGYEEHQAELAAIAGYVHDVGNVINRYNHGITGATLLYPVLREMALDPEDITAILSAVGNHEEQNGKPVSAVSAALIIADKADAHRTRVRRGQMDPHDVHDRVNYAIEQNQLLVLPREKVIRLQVEMNNTSSIQEYMSIYLSRMIMSEQAAAFLGCEFQLVINSVHINNQNSLQNTLQNMQVQPR